MRVHPVVVDLAAYRCPDLDPAVRAEFARTTPRPGLDTADTDGTPSLSRDAGRKWIDRLEVSERRKNGTGLSLADEYDRCRARTVPAAPSPPAATARPAA